MCIRDSAAALQQGLAASLAGRPRMVEPDLFAGRLLTGTTGARVRVTRELADEICLLYTSRCV